MRSTTNKLETIVSVRGTGISGLTSSLVIRESHKAMFLRSDGYYEVFIIKEPPSGDVFGTLVKQPRLVRLYSELNIFY